MFCSETQPALCIFVIDFYKAIPLYHCNHQLRNIGYQYIMGLKQSRGIGRVDDTYIWYTNENRVPICRKNVMVGTVHGVVDCTCYGHHTENIYVISVYCWMYTVANIYFSMGLSIKSNIKGGPQNIFKAIHTAWLHNIKQSYQHSNSNVRRSVTMSRPFKWRVSPRFGNEMEQIAN